MNLQAIYFLLLAPDVARKENKMLKDIMVHLDGGTNDAIRLAHAEKLASLSGSRLVGLYTNPLPEYAYVLAVQSGLAPMEPIIEAEEQMRQNGDRVVAELEQKLAKLPLPHVVRRLDVSASQIVAQAVAQARWADLFVASAPYQKEPILFWDELVEAVMFESGHAIYLVPGASQAPPSLDSIVIGWHPTKEATRAIAEALPILKSGRNIRLAVIDPEKDGAVETSFINEYFKHHGVNVEVLVLDSEKKSVPQVLLHEARSIKAGLIVMGAYGHSRLREWILGGATREMIETSEIPLLMAH